MWEHRLWGWGFFSSVWVGKKVGRRAEDVSGSDRDAWVAGGAIHLERGQREEEMGCFGPPERDRMFLPNMTGLSEAAWHLDEPLTYSSNVYWGLALSWAPLWHLIRIPIRESDRHSEYQQTTKGSGNWKDSPGFCWSFTSWRRCPRQKRQADSDHSDTCHATWVLTQAWAPRELGGCRFCCPTQQKSCSSHPQDLQLDLCLSKS